MGRAEEIVRGWISDASTQPFFWFVNLMECHSPYLPPRPYNDLPFRERFRSGGDVRRFLSYASVARYCMREMEIPVAALDRMRRLYARAVRAMDAWVGRIAEELDRRRMLDDTLLIITSDHGENLGEGHLIGHVMSLDDRLLRVPFVMAGPGATARSSRLTSLADVPRLVAEAAALGAHPWDVSKDEDGVVIAQTEGFRAITRQAVEGLVRAWHLSEVAAERMCMRQTCAFDGRFKLVHDDHGERLFDLEADPAESRDVLGEEPANAARLRVALAQVERATPAPERGEESRRAPGAAVGNENEDLERRLKLLGYL
jgi:arylsulfatase A-like enzyme